MLLLCGRVSSANKSNVWKLNLQSAGEENVRVSVKEHYVKRKTTISLKNICLTYSDLSLKHHMKYPTRGLLNQQLV